MADPLKLLDRVRDAIRIRHYSRRTEEAGCVLLWNKMRKPEGTSVLRCPTHRTHTRPPASKAGGIDDPHLRDQRRVADARCQTRPLMYPVEPLDTIPGMVRQRYGNEREKVHGAKVGKIIPSTLL